MKKIYKATKGGITQDQAEVFGPLLEKMSDGGKKALSAEVILEAAKSKSSPLHDYFEWDDTEAAHQWRLHKARILINHIEIEILNDGSPIIVRQYAHVTQDELIPVDQQGYLNIETVMSDKFLRDRTIRIALEEAEIWMRRYQMYRELGAIFEEIEKMKKKGKWKKLFS